MTPTFRVIDFEKYQHYRDRSPPWIKLYNDLLENYAFGRLPDTGKAHLVAIWLLASRSDNCLPMDPKWVARRINATDPVNLDALRAAGFIDTHPASNLLAGCKQVASTEREGETETETETEGETEAKQNQLSDPQADADQNDPDSRIVEDKKAPRRSSNWRKTYPDAFEAFWRDYPTDPIMSKMRAFTRWQTLSEEDRRGAHAALAPFRAHCAKNRTYRPVHAERFLSQRRFDGFGGAAKTAADALKAMWGGAAAPLVAEIGVVQFQTYFGEAVFDPGPPPRIRIERAILRDLAREKFGAALRRAVGEVELCS